MGIINSDHRLDKETMEKVAIIFMRRLLGKYFPGYFRVEGDQDEYEQALKSLQSLSEDHSQCGTRGIRVEQRGEGNTKWDVQVNTGRFETSIDKEFSKTMVEFAVGKYISPAYEVLGDASCYVVNIYLDYGEPYATISFMNAKVYNAICPE